MKRMRTKVIRINHKKMMEIKRMKKIFWAKKRERRQKVAKLTPIRGEPENCSSKFLISKKEQNSLHMKLKASSNLKMIWVNLPKRMSLGSIKVRSSSKCLSPSACSFLSFTTTCKFLDQKNLNL